MIDVRITPGRLPTRRLRWLTLSPLGQGQAQVQVRAHAQVQAHRHLSAASGLVCAHGRAYVIADDEQHLAVFHDLASAGELHRLLPVDLPLPQPARKRLKADLETLFLLPSAGRSRGQTLVALKLYFSRGRAKTSGVAAPHLSACGEGCAGSLS